MADTNRLVALLDANVLYPAPLRDFLLRLAQAELYIPKWSTEIHEEWIRNLLLNRPDLKASQLERTRQAMDSEFPEAIHHLLFCKNLQNDFRHTHNSIKIGPAAKVI